MYLATKKKKKNPTYVTGTGFKKSCWYDKCEDWLEKRLSRMTSACLNGLGRSNYVLWSNQESIRWWTRCREFSLERMLYPTRYITAISLTGIRVSTTITLRRYENTSNKNEDINSTRCINIVIKIVKWPCSKLCNNYIWIRFMYYLMCPKCSKQL